nr:MAG TPA: protein of unknown function DUF1424 [Inoviridae sp.]
MEDRLHMFSKVVQSGDIVELYIYSHGIPVGSRDYDIVREQKTDQEKEEAERRMDNLYRARQNVRRLIWANIGQYPKFLTLTYAKTILDPRQVKKDVNLFCRYMSRKGYKLRYLYVIEHQKKRGMKEGNEGCLHVHMVIFNDEKIPFEIVNQCWKHGQTDIHKIDDVENLGAYVCKYVTKECFAEYGMKIYNCSLGLCRGIEEKFYQEGLSDTYDGTLHPQQVLDNMKVSYHKKMRHDFVDQDGVLKDMSVDYYQGTWKDVEIIMGKERKKL